jgi:DNA gyrase subunit A
LVDQLAKMDDHVKEIDENLEVNASNGPWVLIASALGLGKRVPATQFKLQKRAGMGLRAIKFRIKDDELVCLKVLGEGEELLFVTEKGVIVRTNADKISQQSRAATGVKLQKLDEGDHLSEVVLVPREQIDETDQFKSGEEN